MGAEVGMKVFLSWSGNKSHRVALVFRDWLPSVIQSVTPYVSSEDIDKGARWSTDIAHELEDSNFGILCVTKENLNEPWLSFEAGALSKTIDKSYVTPFLFDIKKSEVDGPLLQFQFTVFEKNDIMKLMKTINELSGSEGLSEDLLNKSFEVWYPTLHDELSEINGDRDSIDENTRDGNEGISSILEEVLDISRANQKLLRSSEKNFDEMSLEIKNNIENLEKISEKKLPSRTPKLFKGEVDPEVIEDFIQYIFGDDLEKGINSALTFFEDEYPWLSSVGKQSVAIILTAKNKSDRWDAVERFAKTVDFTSGHHKIKNRKSKFGVERTQQAGSLIVRLLEKLASDRD